MKHPPCDGFTDLTDRNVEEALTTVDTSYGETAKTQYALDVKRED